MKFTFFHNNINVLDLDKSVEFYKKALGLEVTKEFHAPDGSFKLVYLGDGTTPHSLALPWHFTKKWIAYVSKTRIWEFTLSMIQMATGLKSAHNRQLRQFKKGQVKF